MQLSGWSLQSPQCGIPAADGATRAVGIARSGPTTVSSNSTSLSLVGGVAALATGQRVVRRHRRQGRTRTTMKFFGEVAGLATTVAKKIPAAHAAEKTIGSAGKVVAGGEALKMTEALAIFAAIATMLPAVGAVDQAIGAASKTVGQEVVKKLFAYTELFSDSGLDSSTSIVLRFHKLQDDDTWKIVRSIPWDPSKEYLHHAFFALNENVYDFDIMYKRKGDDNMMELTPSKAGVEAFLESQKGMDDKELFVVYKSSNRVQDILKQILKFINWWSEVSKKTTK